MKSAIFAFLSILIFLSSCRAVPKNKTDTLPYKDVVFINTGRDTCLFIKDIAGDSIPFIRNFKIIENTMTDTMNVAGNYVVSGETGEYFHVQVDSIKNIIVDNSPENREYIEVNDLPEFYTKNICIYNLSRRYNGFCKGTGMLRIRLYYKPEKKM